MSKPNGIRTGKSVASKASRVLRNGSTSSNIRSIAANALGNRAKKSR